MPGPVCQTLVRCSTDHQVGEEVRKMSKNGEAWLKFAGLVAVGVVVHKATAKQAAALGLPSFTVTLASMAAGAVLSSKLG